MSEEDAKTLRFDRRVSMGVILTLLAQTVAVAWWVSDFKSRTDAHIAENLRRIEQIEKDSMPERLARIEAILERIERQLDKP